LEIQPVADAPTDLVVRVTASSSAGVWQPLLRDADNSLAESVLSLRHSIGGSADPASPPLLGTYRVGEDGRLEFRPKFPLTPGEGYVIRFDPSALPGGRARGIRPIVREHRVPPAPAAGAPRIVGIHPSGDTVPANHLKFYVVFSEPMREGEFLEHFKLLDETGREVPEPFREVELWSVDERRLTLWFHPGRQKTGVNLNVEFGPVLEEGRRYALVVSGGWRSRAGVPLGNELRKTFVAGPADRAQPDVNAWELVAPPAGMRDELEVRFPEALDWALLHSEVWIESEPGMRVDGEATVGPEERSWRFRPVEEWPARAFRLAAREVLEDLAGNSLERPFEVDLDVAPPSRTGPVRYREFEIRQR
jgi:hypothetical protein